MIGNAQRTPLGRSLNVFAETKIYNALQQNGQQLPCYVVSVAGPIVTVRFDVKTSLALPQVSIPIIGSQYVRVPIQPAERGIVIAAATRLGNVSGLAPGVPDLTQPSNLGGLVFVPVGNKEWAAVDGSYLCLYGPSGVKVYDQGNNSLIEVTATNAMMQFGSNYIAVDVDGVKIFGTLFINGAGYLAHAHGGVTTGSGVSGGVV